MDILLETLKNYQIVLDENPVIGGSYLLKNGLFIDLHKTYLNGVFGGSQYKTGIHGAVDNIIRNYVPEILPDSKQIIYYNLLTVCFGAIKLQDGLTLNFERPYMIFPKEMPSEEQFSKLLLWIYHTYQNQSNHVFEIGFGEFRKYWSRTVSLDQDQPGISPEDLIKEIKKFYNIASYQSWEDAINKFSQI